ncbi:MAG TPA: multicopper oxidase domain-containing protein [Prolixibacteraceae bacterium]|nr:multicopper oxidase domain-containing protein [Prolixibacteraceae bacterium]
MSRFYMFLACAFMCQLSVTESMGQYPGSEQEPLNPELIPQYVDFLPHFAGLRVNAKSGGPLVVEAVMTQQVAVSTGTELDNGIVGTDPDAGVGNYFVYRISKDGGNHWTLPLWPSFTIEAQRGVPLNMEFKNKLNGLTYRDVNIAADQTIMMDGVPLTGDPMTEPYTGPVPIALHLHGGEVQSTSDGGPHTWFTPDYELKGKGWNNGVTEILHYPNTQEGATLWYHEHSQLGLTRINVYAGMAGFYFLRDSREEIIKLPGWSGDDLVQEVTPEGKTADALHPDPYLPEIEIVIQDRMFDTKGQLYYQTDEAPNPDIHPFWNPEFFGDVITVNGKTWPYLSVAPRKYRFHFLNGSNARFYNLWLQDDKYGAKGPAFIQVGTDGGMLQSPVVIDPVSGKKLLMGPGERCDIVIDFSKVSAGTTLTLMNNANTPYPDGDPVEVGTTDRIMQFIVNGKMVDNKVVSKPGKDKSHIAPNLRGKPMVQLTDFAGNVKVTPEVTRQLTLNEVLSETGPLTVLINNTPFESLPGMDMVGDVTEKPVEGTTEVWQLINMTMDAHPMHMHLVQFQLVSRQDFDMEEYMEEYMDSFTGENGGMEGMYMGAEGPPRAYDEPNRDGAVGGNPGVNKYLIGSPVPPEANERGWKDVIIAYPDQVTTYIVRFAPTDMPLSENKSSLKYTFDPSVGPGYVWHCHIVEHEDNDMMRPMDVQPNPSRLNVKSGEMIAENLVPKEGFSLQQNTPNPFTGQTEISFQLSEECPVQLILYNSQGSAIKNLLNATAPAGSHKVVFDADNLSSGIYFYRLKAGSFVETKKMIID